MSRVPRPSIVLPVGTNLTRLWGLTARERLARIAAARDMSFGSGPREGPLMANLHYAFDPFWLDLVAEWPDHVVTRDGVPVVAHCRAFETRTWIALAMKDLRPLEDGGVLTVSGWEDWPESEGVARPYMGRLLDPEVRKLERESYAAAIGPSDLLTRFVWSPLARPLVRASLRSEGNPPWFAPAALMLGIAAAFLLRSSDYGPGLAVAFAALLFAAADAVTARLSLISSWWRRAMARLIEIAVPLLWWWAWADGLAAHGRPLNAATSIPLLAVLFGGHAAQQWLRSRAPIFESGRRLFELVAAGPGPNLLILLASLLAGRPDLGLIAIAGWTAASLAVQIGLATLRARRTGT